MKALCRDLGRMDYKTCWDLQQSLFDALLAGKTAGEVAYTNTPEQKPDTKAAVPDSATGMPPKESLVGTILLVEHPPVYTLGKSGHAENLLIDREGLERLGATFYHIDRGGDITFHGPGQLVCYPILDLEKLGIGLRTYIEALEEAVIRTLAEYGIAAGRIAGASGVWVTAWGRNTEGGNGEDTGLPKVETERKICAIGVRSSRYITMHGFALNVSTDLRWFSRINPCGFTDKGVTSIERQTGRSIPMDEVKALVVKF